jgi:hypothetical protein
MNSKKVLVASGLVLLLVGGLAGYLDGVNSTAPNTTTMSTKTVTLTTTTSVSTSLDAYAQLATSFTNHVFFLSSRNVSAIVSQYEDNATVTWIGRAHGIRGLFNGTKSIFLLMNVSFIGHGTAFALGDVTRNIVDIKAKSAAVNSSFAVFGQNGFEGSAAIGDFNGTVSAQDSYVYSVADGVWLISQETWNFTSFSSQVTQIG